MASCYSQVWQETIWVGSLFQSIDSQLYNIWETNRKGFATLRSLSSTSRAHSSLNLGKGLIFYISVKLTGNASLPLKINDSLPRNFFLQLFICPFLWATNLRLHHTFKLNTILNNLLTFNPLPYPHPTYLAKTSFILTCSSCLLFPSKVQAHNAILTFMVPYCTSIDPHFQVGWLSKN